MTTRELRRKYLDFFKSKGHDEFPSGSLIPFDVTGRLDESLLFNGAGMVQFKPYFRGVAQPPNKRLSTAQKCVRTGDIDEVGDVSHLTFFEMLGNFSFGDYFKKEAIAYSWEFLTSKEWLGLDPKRLSFTIFSEDDLAFDCWAEQISKAGINPEDRVFRLGEDTNYWPAGSFTNGPPGPCGPNSEMFYWTSNDEPAPSGPYSREDYLRDEAAGKWLEIWNDVFIQFDWQGHLRNPDRPGEGYVKDAMPNLPFQSIDTGMGLERTSAVLGGFSSVYDTDAFQAIIRVIEGVGSGLVYGQGAETDRAIRIISDHIRTACFCIADGILPSNNGRGYVLRRLIRRAVLKGQRTLGFEQPFFHLVYEGVASTMGDHYTELIEKRDVIVETLRNEEAQFRRTISQGSEKLTNELHDQLFQDITSAIVARLPEATLFSIPQGMLLSYSGNLGISGDTINFGDLSRYREVREALSELLEPGWNSPILDRLSRPQLGGSLAFQLYDTYGFPLEVTQELCAEAGVTVDVDGYEAAMKEAQERSRSADQRESVYGGIEGGFLFLIRQEAGPQHTFFDGYNNLELDAHIIAAIPETDEQGVTTGHIAIALDRTPFYAESGGQISDSGRIVGAGFELMVLDLIKQDGIYVHLCEPLKVSHPDDFKGMPAAELQEILNRQFFKQEVSARVEASRRARITRHHTATHLLHAALRHHLGKHVTQAGSQVSPDHLRFDFTHGKAMTDEEIAKVEQMVNEEILRGHPVVIHEGVPIQQAKAMGAMALFGEKYGEFVRVVDIRDAKAQPVSVELCGGCHVPSTAQIGFFKILHEASAASGVRRIEAVAGESAMAWANEQHEALQQAASLLKATPHDVLRAIEKTLEQLKDERKKREKLMQQSAGGAEEKVTQVGSVELAVRELDGVDPKEAQQVADRLVEVSPKRVALVVVTGEGKVTFIAKVGKEAVASGANAGALVKELATRTGGGGGGRPDFATAGGRNLAQLGAAMAAVVEILGAQVQ